MSLFELFLIYTVSWWMVLFMVLPWGVKIAAKPAPGHAASAPVNAHLKRKLIITSILALFVPLIAYGVSEARAASGIYHAGSDECTQPADVNADSMVEAMDSNATIGGSSNADMGIVPTYLDAPATDYSNNGQLDRLGAGVVNVGVAQTDTKTGEVRINGTTVGSHATQRPSHCK